MASLTDVYGGGVGSAVPPSRRRVGAGIVAVGGALVLLALVLGAGPVADRLGYRRGRELAGILAGVGLPIALLGVVAVLPASTPTRAAAGIGAGLAVLAVGLFSALYPDRWVSGDPVAAVAVMTIYTLSVLITVWCLLVGGAALKRRRDPGDTARLAVTETGTVRVVRRATPGLGQGSVGRFGPAVEQTTDRSTAGTAVEAPGDPTTGTDAAETGHTGAASGSDRTEPSTGPDPYCGNCQHVEYTRINGDLAPYCGYHERRLEDMQACGAWTSTAGEPEPEPEPDS